MMNHVIRQTQLQCYNSGHTLFKLCLNNNVIPICMFIHGRDLWPLRCLTLFFLSQVSVL